MASFADGIGQQVDGVFKFACCAVVVIPILLLTIGGLVIYIVCK